MPEKPRYGRRTISSMLGRWNAHRKAVASGDIEAIQETFDQCEPWIEFAFENASEAKMKTPYHTELTQIATTEIREVMAAKGWPSDDAVRDMALLRMKLLGHDAYRSRKAIDAAIAQNFKVTEAN